MPFSSSYYLSHRKIYAPSIWRSSDSISGLREYAYSLSRLALDVVIISPPLIVILKRSLEIYKKKDVSNHITIASYCKKYTRYSKRDNAFE